MGHCLRCNVICGQQDLPFCTFCDGVLSLDAAALRDFERASGIRFWLLCVRSATHESLGGITASNMGGTSRMDTDRGAWTIEAANPRTTRMLLVAVTRGGTVIRFRDREFPNRATDSYETDRQRRLDDPRDPIWLGIDAEIPPNGDKIVDDRARDE